MTSPRTKRIIIGVVVVFVLLIVLVLGAGGYGAYMLTRDPGFDWENPNKVEAKEANRKLKLYEASLTNGAPGFVRLSQLEINSYLMVTVLTNDFSTNAAGEFVTGPYLKRVGVGLVGTNFSVYTAAERRIANRPVRFVVQREFHVELNDTNECTFPMYSMKIGKVEIPEKYWDRVKPLIEPLDAPVLEQIAWRTNIQGVLVTKNELTKRAELRLYTYRPVPVGDLR